MFRKMTLVAVPAVAFALTLFANVDSASQAFAKGGSGSHGGRQGAHDGRGLHRDFGRRGYNRYFGGYFGWDYPCYGCVEYPVYSVSVVQSAPVVEAPLAEAPVAVAPVCTTCEPVVSSLDGYGAYWGHRRDFRRHEGFRGNSGRSGHGRK
jgi:hypothetical protein